MLFRQIERAFNKYVSMYLVHLLSIKAWFLIDNWFSLVVCIFFFFRVQLSLTIAHNIPLNRSQSIISDHY